MRKFALFLAVTGLLLAAQNASAAPTVTRFDFTGAQQSFTVPAGITSMHVVAIGGKGGANHYQTVFGGFGAVVSADVAVTPGQVLIVVVGGNGGDAETGPGGEGGFNGGGAGGNPGGQGSFGPGGGGGGMSDVHTADGFLTGGLIVAAGGGGSGGGFAGGAGGNAADADGQNGEAGAAGTAKNQGVAGGSGGAPGNSTTGAGKGSGGGGNGSIGSGGAGGDGNYNLSAAAGGGGGGGFFGGAGGGANTQGGGSYGGGGGAGTSASNRDKATNTSYTRDKTGVPSITFTYDLPQAPGGGGNGGGGGGGNSPALAPALSKLKASPRTFVAASRGGSTGGTVGTTISYTSAVAGTTTFTVLAPRRGVTAAKCVKPRRGSHGKRCTRYVSMGTFTHKDVAGFNTFVFTGRVRRHKLSRGSYKLQAVSKADGKKSAPVTLSFRIAR
jgi:hypothetical protein